MKKVALGVAVSLMAAQSVADHWVELDAGYTFGDYSSQDSWWSEKAEYSIPSFSAQVYIPSVSTASGSYEEAGFLAQASTVYFSNEVTGVDRSFRPLSGGDEREYSYHLRETAVGGYGVINRWLIGGEVASIVGNGDHYADVYEVVGGYYVGKAALLSASLGAIQIDCDACDDERDSDTAFELNYHQVFLASEPMSYAIDVDWMKTDDSHRYGVEGTMYFTPKMGLTLRAEKNTADTYSDTDLSVKYQLFINENVGFSVSYIDSEYEGSDSGDAAGLISLGLQVNI